MRKRKFAENPVSPYCYNNRGHKAGRTPVVALKVRKIGNSEGVTIPREVLAAMHVKEGDTLFLTEAAGGFRLTPYDPEFERQMGLAREIMKSNRNMLRQLAKR
jgi:putative addiction module antidote